ncbi:hypothetical protein C0993_009040 [Termitomyces sp. T159_Od127]|nr:hypothetical protein C0993_009040 [Termitomyces sp. T159_Od127]
MFKLHLFLMAPPPQLCKTPDSIPSATKLELCIATLKCLQKAHNNGCAIEDFMRHMKKKEKGKARAEHEFTPELKADDAQLFALHKPRPALLNPRIPPNNLKKKKKRKHDPKDSNAN